MPLLDRQRWSMIYPLFGPAQHDGRTDRWCSAPHLGRHARAPVLSPSNFAAFAVPPRGGRLNSARICGCIILLTRARAAAAAGCGWAVRSDRTAIRLAVQQAPVSHACISVESPSPVQLAAQAGRKQLPPFPSPSRVQGSPYRLPRSCSDGSTRCSCTKAPS